MIKKLEILVRFLVIYLKLDEVFALGQPGWDRGYGIDCCHVFEWIVFVINTKKIMFQKIIYFGNSRSVTLKEAEKSKQHAACTCMQEDIMNPSWLALGSLSEARFGLFRLDNSQKVMKFNQTIWKAYISSGGKRAALKQMVIKVTKVSTSE